MEGIRAKIEAAQDALRKMLVLTDGLAIELLQLLTIARSMAMQENHKAADLICEAIIEAAQRKHDARVNIEVTIFKR
ncbi:MAG: hypothetical protein AB1700_05255 [Bacillota bacterium]